MLGQETPYKTWKIISYAKRFRRYTGVFPMLISDKYKFIFIKPPRTAGSTVEELLTPYANIFERQHMTALEAKRKYKEKNKLILENKIW